MKKRWIKRIVLLLAVCLAVGLCVSRVAKAQGAGQLTSGKAAPPTPAPTVLFPDGSGAAADTAALDLSGLTAADTEQALGLLEEFTALKELELGGEGGPFTFEQAADVQKTRPGLAVHYAFSLAGKDRDLADTVLDLRTLRGGEVEGLLPRLRLMTGLKEIDLGSERSGGPDWEQIAAMREAAPQASIRYHFELYGVPVDLEDEEIDINHIEVTDRGAYVRRVIACMPRLRYLCMDSCGVENEDMAAIRDDFPDVEVVWRIWFGATGNYSVRTNVIKILASKTTWAGELTNEYVDPIKYCTKLKYLDLGHNEYITDLSFVRSMPDLEVLIISMNYGLEDLTPLADCRNLEYFETSNTLVKDLTPLSGLDKLRHLNLGACWVLQDITPVYGLELERLYLGGLTPVPQEQVDEYRRLHPDCDVNNTLPDATQGSWRYADEYATEYTPRYALLREQMGYDTLDYSVYWLDPYYEGEREEE